MTNEPTTVLSKPPGRKRYHIQRKTPVDYEGQYPKALCGVTLPSIPSATIVVHQNYPNKWQEFLLLLHAIRTFRGVCKKCDHIFWTWDQRRAGTR